MNSIFQLLRQSLENGSIVSLSISVLLAYFGGILSSFTPCIYPMIPITVGFIGGASERSVKDGWVLSSFYVLGMAFVYSALGVAAAISGKIFGTLTNTPGWYLVLGVVMIASSLWMFDVIKFDPAAWIDRFNRARRKHKPIAHTGPGAKKEATKFGAFFLGASSGFIAAPCTTPVLTTILSYVANQKSVLFGGLLMFAFALGLGTILVIIGTFAGALKVLPKSGKWLETVKYASGFLILAFGEYFIFLAGMRAK